MVFVDKITQFSLELIDLFIQMAPYLAFGLLFVGILHLLISKEAVAKYLGPKSKFAVTKASLFGVPLPLCSCGVVPTALFLKKNGASNGAVTSFLISTPQTGIDSIVATFGMMGPVFGFLRPISAFFSGIFGGKMVDLFLKNEEIKTEEEKSCCCKKEKETCSSEAQTTPVKLTKVEKLKSVFHYSFIEFFDDISTHFAVGILIAALISFFIPEDFFSTVTLFGIHLNEGLPAMFLMILIGLPMYTCSTSSIPIALSLMMKGFSPGAAFVFLFAGPVANAASFSVLLKALGGKVMAVYVASISFSAIVIGLFFDFFLSKTGLHTSVMNHIHHQDSHSIFSLIISALFALLLFYSLGKKGYKRIKN